MAEKEHTFTKGSEGSRVCDCNIRKYPTVGAVDEHAPASTDHPFCEVDGTEELHKPLATEAGRRQLNRNRDNRKRWSVINSPLGIVDRKSPNTEE